MRRREWLVSAGLAGALWPWSAGAGTAVYVPSVVIAWNRAATSAFAATSSGPTVAARALSMLYEAVYNAWACYGNVAKFTLPGLRARPSKEWTTDNKSIAVSYAAYGVLVDLFPSQKALFDSTLLAAVATLPTAKKEGTAAIQNGQLAASALLQGRHGDGSNQLAGYADTSGYVPVNGPDVLVDPTRWQPLRVTNAAGVTSVQQFLTPHWGTVRPFALTKGSAFRPVFSPAAPTMDEMNQLISFSANLSEANKAQVELYANNPGSVTPPGQWAQDRRDGVGQ